MDISRKYSSSNSLSSLNSSEKLSKSYDSSSSLNSLDNLSKSFDSGYELSKYYQDKDNNKNLNIKTKVNNFISIDNKKKIKRNRDEILKNKSSPQIDDVVKRIIENSISPSLDLNLSYDHYKNFKK